MKKILMLCCSDVLGIPALLKLKQQNNLAAIAFTDKVAPRIIPILQSVGFTADEMHILTKKDLETELNTLITKYQPEALFTLTFSWMIPDAILNRLPNRCINFHGGLLPKYKGADPVFWQIKNGEKNGGFSIHIMTSELDAGPVLLTEEMPIYPGETYGLYTQRLGMLAADAVTKVLDGVGTLQPQPVTTSAHPDLYLKRPTGAQLTINWQQQTASQIENLVNAANPNYNGAATSIRQSKIYLLEVAPADVNNPEDQQFPPGTIIHADQLYGIIVACINKQFIKINVVSMQQGYFSGSKLFNMGFRVGEVFM
ncbi:MAG: formyltransferase family protein [Mucilaginibacter sp.]|uniref:methionyl-tRNA formyltransferase n=1 Tax=Mucilaginibacter sp. TaxID=1882438 RepID=UPI00326378EC